MKQRLLVGGLVIVTALALSGVTYALKNLGHVQLADAGSPPSMEQQMPPSKSGMPMMPNMPQGDQGQPMPPAGDQGQPMPPAGDQGQPMPPQGDQGQPMPPVKPDVPAPDNESDSSPNNEVISDDGGNLKYAPPTEQKLAPPTTTYQPSVSQPSRDSTMVAPQNQKP